MSGHSKWSTIKRQKGSADAKRGMLFTKLAKSIAMAARNGSDPEHNSSLRIAMDAAKRANMPKSNIERAIQRGSGELGGEALEEILYEGFGPEGVGLLVEVITDNRNRAAAEIKKLLQAQNGRLGGSGSVQWMFDRLGLVEISSRAAQQPTWENFELQLIDAGAANIETLDDVIQITCPLDRLASIKQLLEQAQQEVLAAEPAFIPKDPQALSKEAAASLEQLISSLHDHPDVNGVSSTASNPK